jgi:DNA-binding transcriptional LysR family regulator
METNRLKQFCTVVETGSLSGAADLLGITHSGLHKSLRVLEGELGFTLTVGKGRGIEITERGRQFYPSAIEILKTIEKACRNDSMPDSEEYRIGSLEIFLKLLPKQLLTNPAFSHRRICFQEMGPGEIESAVQNRILDVGITYIPMPTEGVEYLRIGKFRMGVFCAQAGLASKPLSEIPFVVPSASLNTNPLDILNNDGWKEGLFLRKVAYKASSLATAVDIVRMGKAAVFMPTFLKNSFDVRLYEKECPVRKDIREAFLVLRSNKAESKEEKVLAKALRGQLRVD